MLNAFQPTAKNFCDLSDSPLCGFQSRERGRGMFQHRSNIEKALSFLKKKSVNNLLKGLNITTNFIWKTVLLVLNQNKLKITQTLFFPIRLSCLDFDSNICEKL